MPFILLITCLFRLSTSEIIVETTSGPIRGVVSPSHDVEAFLGIPYAEPPIGDLRFAKPVPKRPWERIYNASSLPPPCAQLGPLPVYYVPDFKEISEDCLYLNVWAPKNHHRRNLRPVIIYIHPGAFIIGSSNLRVHDGSHFASRGDVIVVTINYRLAMFGYFLAYIEEADGNMGIFDQIMAIKWVKDNALNFGGDPNNIVLFGASAGAQSISAHMLSPLSKNLFNKAILHSGGILHPFFLDDNARLYKNSETVASILGCTNGSITFRENPQAVVNCLKTKPKEELIAAELTLQGTNFYTFYPRTNDAFLPKDSASLLREGKFRRDVPVLAGINKDEGPIFVVGEIPTVYNAYSEDPNVTKEFAVSYIRGLGKERLRLTRVSEIINFYQHAYTNGTAQSRYTQFLSNIHGDYIVACSTVFIADYFSVKGNPVYFYKFEYKSPSNPTADWYGTAHIDEVQYIFGRSYHGDGDLTAEEIKVSHQMMDRWSAFAKTGNPNLPNHLPWFKYNYHNPLYLDIGQEEESIRLEPLHRCEFWRERFMATFNHHLIQWLQTSDGFELDKSKQSTWLRA